MASSSSSSSSNDSSIIALKHEISELCSTLRSRNLVPSSRHFYFLSSGNTLKDAIELLARYRILSAPVFDIHRQICLGAIDLLMIAQFIAKKHKNQNNNNKNIHHSSNNNNKSSDYSDVDGTTPIEEVLSSDKKHARLASFFQDNPVSLLIDFFAQQQIHRVAFFDSSCELTTPCSQSDVIVWLSEEYAAGHCKSLSSIYIKQIIHQNNGLKQTPICVNEKKTVVEACHVMSEYNVSCVGVLNSTGQLIASFSPSDLRGLHEFSTLSMSVLDYLKQYSSSSLSPVLINESTNLSIVLTKLSQSRTHRAWMVDENQCPLRVFTLTDVMKILSSDQKVREEQANGGMDVSKLWSSKTNQITLDTSHLFQRVNIGDVNLDDGHESKDDDNVPEKNK